MKTSHDDGQSIKAALLLLSLVSSLRHRQPFDHGCIELSILGQMIQAFIVKNSVRCTSVDVHTRFLLLLAAR